MKRKKITKRPLLIAAAGTAAVLMLGCQEMAYANLPACPVSQCPPPDLSAGVDMASPDAQNLDLSPRD